jgi:DNA-binding transcriptional MerR regulator
VTSTSHTALTVAEMARATGLTPDTLRYYERIGVLNAVTRADNGHRRYHAHDVDWMAFVLRLKRTGMPLAQIRSYAQLREAGNTTLAPRQALLEAHERWLVAQLDDLGGHLTALRDKLQWYREQSAAQPKSRSSTSEGEREHDRLGKQPQRTRTR